MEFLLSEVWWVDVIIAAAITAIAGILAGVLTFKSRVEKKIDGVEKELSKEHGGLSKEHIEIKSKVDYLNNSIAQGNKSTNQVKDMMIKEKINNKHNYKNLTKKQKAIKDSVSTLAEFAKELEILNTHNLDLQNKNAQLEERNSELLQKLAVFRQKE